MPPSARTAALRRGRWVPHLILIPVLLAWIYPFVWMISTSFKSRSDAVLGGISLIPDQFRATNYGTAWEVGHFGRYAINSIIVSVGVVVVVLIVSSTAGYALGRGSIPGKRLILGLLVVSLFMPKGYVIIPIYTLIGSLGLNNSLAGIVLAEAGPTQVVSIMLFAGYFAKIPRDVEESALVDGAGFLQIFSRIMFPLARPVIGTVSLFTFIGTWNAFLIPLVFTLSRPDLRTLGVGIYNFVGEDATNWPALAAASCITVLPVLIVFIRLQRMFVEGISGAVKG